MNDREADSATESEALADRSSGNAPLEWTVNPWKENPRNAALGVFLVVGMGGVLVSMGFKTALSGLLWVAFMLALSPAFWVLHCRVDDTGVARRILFLWERRPWDRIRKAKLAPSGLVVWPSERLSWVDSAFRGLWLPFYRVPDEARADLVSELRQRLGAHDLRG